MSHRPSHRPGRHELGQNFLVDRRTVDLIASRVATSCGPILELAAGDGALTRALLALRRPVTAVELDPDRTRRLRRLPGVTVVCGDLLRVTFPPGVGTIVANLPFHITTAALRRILAEPGWRDAVLLVQWEVARRRAGVGGASLLTATWWPWYEFELLGRVPARAFRPVPSVDGGVLAIRRRSAPAVADRTGYQAFVRRVFEGSGMPLQRILQRAGLPRRPVATWLRRSDLVHAHPKDLGPAHWVELWGMHPHGRTLRES